MRFKCKGCGRVLTKSFDTCQDSEIKDSVLGRRWYTDEHQVNHLAILCMNCFHLHDCIGSPWKMLFTLFQNGLSVEGHFSPDDLVTLKEKEKSKESSGFWVAISKHQGLHKPEDVLRERVISERLLRVIERDQDIFRRATEYVEWIMLPPDTSVVLAAYEQRTQPRTAQEITREP